MPYVVRRKQTYHRKQSQEITLIPGPALAGHQVQWDEQLCILYIDQVLIFCTLTEFRLVKLLLERSGQRVSTRDLIAQFGDTSTAHAALTHAARTKLARQMCRIRAKFWPCGLEVVSLMGYGYMLINLNAPADRSMQ
ncbi:MAG: hypothetical protein ACRDHW_08545 [Ktedonobacteraceae bacterium]